MESLKLRRVAIDTYKENVVFLHRDCELYRSEGFQALNKIEIHAEGAGELVIAVLNVVDDERITTPAELGLSEQVFAQLGKAEGTAVYVNHATSPESLASVRAKIAGSHLEYDEILAITRDIAANRYSKIEITAFLVACAVTGLEREEIVSLTRAMVATGERLDWGESLVVDKHCIGGIPGNRTSLLITPIVAAHGLLMPKTSSRAITSPAGSADTMEVFARVELGIDRLREIVKHERACLAWGGTARLAPVDDILISVERPLGMDSPGQMIASILSKKVAAGASHLLIDIPVGPTAKVRKRSEAMKLRKLFEYAGDLLGLHLEVVISDGKQPIGRGIGPVLEARDVMLVLENDPLAPMDLKEKSLQLAGRILEFDADVRGGQGYFVARDILESGRALDKFKHIIKAQGASPKCFVSGRLTQDIVAPASGRIAAIDNLQMARIARLAGAPMDKGAGIDLYKKLGEEVRASEPIYRIYSEFNADFEFARQAAEIDNGYRIEKDET
ncbi:MAG TPA: thymidine phosphorylase family protein [Gammaproteobacteria bacterium]|nr:thymidine phosphorylase family protein [Gammaproteobacteria bacterium]